MIDLFSKQPCNKQDNEAKEMSSRCWTCQTSPCVRACVHACVCVCGDGLFYPVVIPDYYSNAPQACSLAQQSI